MIVNEIILIILKVIYIKNQNSENLNLIKKQIPIAGKKLQHDRKILNYINNDINILTYGIL